MGTEGQQRQSDRPNSSQVLEAIGDDDAFSLIYNVKYGGWAARGMKDGGNATSGSCDRSIRR